MMALAAAFDAAQDAIEALDTADRMRSRMDELLQRATSAMQQERLLRGNKPAMGDRWIWFGRLSDDDLRKAPRAAAHAALKALLAVVWLPLTSTERTQRQREDAEYKAAEQERNTDAKHQKTLLLYQRGADDWDRTVRCMESRKRREEREARDIAAHSAKWAEVCAVFKTCGLAHLGTVDMLKQLRAEGILPSLYEVPAAIPESARDGEELDMPRRGLLAATTTFLNGGDGAVSDSVLLRADVVKLHHALACARFERFVTEALKTLEVVQPADGAESLASVGELADDLYAAFWRADDSAEAFYRQDLDLAERLGAAWVAGQHVDMRSVDELLRQSVLRDAADGLLRFARSRYCMRGVLIETLQRGGPFVTEAQNQMVSLLKNTSMGIEEGHVDALLWFLGRREYVCRGRLWATRTDGTYPRSPGLLATLARGSPERVATLTKQVLVHSVVWREPIRRFLDAHWLPYLAASHAGKEWLEGCDAMYNDLERQDRQLRRLCAVLMPIAIEVCDWSRPSDVLLFALRHVANGGNNATIEQLRQTLRLRFYVPRQHACDVCSRYKGPHGQCFLMDSDWDGGWTDLIATTQTDTVPTLRALSRNAVRRQLMESLSVEAADVTAPRPPIDDALELDAPNKRVRIVAERVRTDNLVRAENWAARWTYRDFLGCFGVQNEAMPPFNQFTSDWRAGGCPGLFQAFEARRRVDVALVKRLQARPCPHEPMCKGCPIGGHDQQLGSCPEFAMAHLLASIALYLATPRSATPPMPAHLDPGDEDEVFDDESYEERRDRHLYERVWAPYAFP